MTASLCLRAQVYSFGVLLWQMFTGKAPFAGHHEGQLGGRMSDMLARLLYRACCCSLVPVTYRLSALVFVCAAQVAVGVMTGSLQLEWPTNMPPPLARLGQACCRHEPEQRPTFKVRGRSSSHITTRNAMGRGATVGPY